jgi:hypothetical protein
MCDTMARATRKTLALLEDLLGKECGFVLKSGGAHYARTYISL